jgi:hypothetical protein
MTQEQEPPLISNPNMRPLNKGEDLMPDFSNCEKDEYGNYYCYDTESEEIYGIRLEKIPVKTIPQEVLIKMLRKASKKSCNKG